MITVDVGHITSLDESSMLVNGSGTPNGGLIVNGEPSGELAVNWWGLVCVPLVLFTAAGNLLVCLAIVRDRRLQNMTNYFLMSLALTDLMVAVLVMPLAIVVLVLGYFPLPAEYCMLWTTLDVLLCTASIMHLCTLSVDRYLSLSYPMRFGRNKTCRRVLVKLLAVWLVSATQSVALCVISVRHNRAMLVDGVCGVPEPLFQLVGSVLCFYIPLVIMLVTYWLTVRLLNRKQRVQRLGASFRHGGQPDADKQPGRPATALMKPVGRPTEDTSSLHQTVEHTSPKLQDTEHVQLRHHTTDHSPIEHHSKDNGLMKNYTTKQSSTKHNSSDHILMKHRDAENTLSEQHTITPTVLRPNILKQTRLRHQTTDHTLLEQNKAVTASSLNDCLCSSSHGTHQADRLSEDRSTRYPEEKLSTSDYISVSSCSSIPMIRIVHQTTAYNSACSSKTMKSPPVYENTTHCFCTTPDAGMKRSRSEETAPTRLSYRTIVRSHTWWFPVRKNSRTDFYDSENSDESAEYRPLTSSCSSVDTVLLADTIGTPAVGRGFGEQHCTLAAEELAGKKCLKTDHVEEHHCMVVIREHVEETCCSKTIGDQDQQTLTTKVCNGSPQTPYGSHLDITLAPTSRRNSRLMVHISPSIKSLGICSTLSSAVRRGTATGRKTVKHRTRAASHSIRTEQKATKVLGVIFFTFVFLWSPFFVINILTPLCEPCERIITPDVIHLVTWLGYISSLVNPIFYTLFNKTFRVTFRKILLCQQI